MRTVAEEAGDQVEAAHRVVPLTRLRSAVARTVTASAAVPQFDVAYDVQVEGLASVRADLGGDVSVTDMIHAAVATAVPSHPRVNASWTEQGIVEHRQVNLGFALALEEQDGLVVPAIVDADRLSLVHLAERRRELTSTARNGNLSPADLFSATICVSNLGSTGVSSFRALVLPPQAAILAVGAVRRDGTVTLTLSCDHRVVDGLPAALFLREVADRLSNPTWMLHHGVAA